MQKRGRKSVASLAVAVTGPIETVRRPGPPAELTEEQATEWREVVSRMSADWFPRETHAMLVSYCRHVVAERHIAQLIELAEKPSDDPTVGLNVKYYGDLLKMQERESRAISSLSTRMRITQQATVRAEKARKPSAAATPWD